MAIKWERLIVSVLIGILVIVVLYTVVAVGYRWVDPKHDYKQGAIDLPYVESRWEHNESGSDSCSDDSACPCAMSTCNSLPAWKAMTGSACRDFAAKGPQFVRQFPVFQ